MKNLDEKGFVFIDTNRLVCWCRLFEGAILILVWDIYEQRWIIAREISKEDFFLIYPLRIPEEAAEEYHRLHQEYLNSLD